MFKPNQDIAKLTDIAIVIMGQSPASADCNETSIGLPLLNGPTEFGPHHPTPVQFTTDAKRIAEKGDLLFCVRGSTTGRMNWADRRYAIGRGLASIRSKDGPQSSPFVRAVIEYKLDELLTAATGSTFPNVSREQLGGMQFPLPPLPEQRRIAKILGDLDDKIELNRKMNETLEQMARALFKSWFVDFDPVRAKMEGRQPSGMDAATAALFPDRLVDSELGPIPEGWEVKALGEVAVNPRRSINPSEFSIDTAYIGLEHIPKRSIALAEWTSAESVASGKSQFRRGEILFGKLRPYFHKVGVAPIDGVCSTDILVIGPKSSVWFGFVLGHVSSDELVQFADQASTGTRMPRASWSDIESYQAVIPDSSLAAMYNEFLNPIINQITSNIHQSRTLSTLRDTLLPKLVGGEVRVGGVV